MQVTRLFLSSFRNFAALELQPGPGINIFYGANGAGKTNLLEALYFLSAGRSHRTPHDADLLTRGGAEFIIRADLRGTVAPWLRATYQPQRGCVISTPEAAAPARTAALILPLVLFAPEDLELASGQPALRRRFLDQVAGQVQPAYQKVLGRYARALEQRNELLREAQARHLRGELLEAWDEEMGELAGQLWSARSQVLDALNPLLERCYRDLAEGAAAMAWVPALTEIPDSAGSADPVVWERSLRQELARRRREEIRYGVTLAGPHRDSVWFTVDGREVRQYGSRGEQRSVALAARLAQFALLRQRVGAEPVLLLDDVFAELDQRRQQSLTAGLPASTQVFLTCVAPDRLPSWPGRVAHYFRVAEGQVSARGEDEVPPGRSLDGDLPGRDGGGDPWPDAV
ncbi:MAG: DNA replication/repair protein RecF [Bacillota bacterium]